LTSSLRRRIDDATWLNFAVWFAALFIFDWWAVHVQQGLALFSMGIAALARLFRRKT